MTFFSMFGALEVLACWSSRLTHVPSACSTQAPPQCDGLVHQSNPWSGGSTAAGCLHVVEPASDVQCTHSDTITLSH